MPWGSTVTPIWIDDTPIGRNDPCPCNSGRKFKWCCRPLVERPPHAGRLNVGRYLSSEDLWPGRRVDRSEVEAGLARFERLQLMFRLATMNIVLAEDYGRSRSPVERVVLEQFLSDVEFRKVCLWLDSKRAERVLHRLLIPTAMQLVLISNVGPGVGTSIEGREREVGSILLDLNAVLEGSTPEKVRFNGDDESRRTLAARVYRVLFYSHHENLGGAIARSWLLFNDGMLAVQEKHPAESFDFVGEFEKNFGFSYDHLTAVVFAIIARYGENWRPKVPIDWCIGAGYFWPHLHQAAREAVPRVLSYLGADFDDHRSRMRSRVEGQSDGPIFDGFSIYDRPLLELEPDVYIPLDLQYLAASLSAAPFWRFLADLYSSRRELEANQLKIAMGRSMEWYTAALLRPAQSVSTTKYLWLDWDEPLAVGSGVPTPDALLLEESVLFVIEITTRSITPGVATSADPDQLEDGFRKVWFGDGKETRGKLAQLERAWCAARRHELPVPNLPPDVRVVPVLVTLRYEPQDPVIARWHRGMLLANRMAPEFVDSLIAIDIADLERLMELKMRGHTWRQVLNDFRGSPYSGQGFANYLYYSGIHTDRHPMVQDAFERVAGRFVPALFGDRLRS